MAAGCAGQSAPPLSVASLGSPPAGMARIVVLRKEKGFFGYGDRSFNLKIDDQPMGDLMTGGLVFADRPPGRHQLAADLWDIPGVTHYDIDAARGRTYYLMARLDDNVNGVEASGMMLGLAGRAVATVVSPFGGEKGAISLTPLSEAEARAAMQ